jgi:hypothetical protein
MTLSRWFLAKFCSISSNARSSRRSKPIGAPAEVHWLRGHQHPHSRRNGNHVAALTARSTTRSRPRSTPLSARTTAPAISTTIDTAPLADAPAALTSRIERHRRLPPRANGTASAVPSKLPFGGRQGCGLKTPLTLDCTRARCVAKSAPTCGAVCQSKLGLNFGSAIRSTNESDRVLSL